MTDQYLFQIGISALQVILLALTSWALRSINSLLIRIAVIEEKLSVSVDMFKALAAEFHEHRKDPNLHYARFTKVEDATRDLRAELRALKDTVRRHHGE